MSDLHRYRDREHAGRVLAEEVEGRLPDRGDALLLALPRGGLPVAYEIARTLRLPMDVLIVRKLGLPTQPELAMGAIASGGLRVLNDQVIRMGDVDEETIRRVEREERAELLRREDVYRGARPAPTLEGRTVILVDDGVATGSTIRAAIRAVRTQGPRRVVVAVPVASPDVVEQLRGEADLVLCPLLPFDLFAIGAWYDSFPQLTDDQVAEILDRAWRGKDPSAREPEAGG